MYSHSLLIMRKNKEKNTILSGIGCRTSISLLYETELANIDINGGRSSSNKIACKVAVQNIQKMLQFSLET